ncbi:MAG: exo-beta-N-acetylmuramidase NamZ domain-containing protein [Vulcanimicrobiaceae bacterium]
MNRRAALALLSAPVAACAAAAASAAVMPPASVTLGDEVFLRDGWHDLRGRCTGIVTNQTGVTSRLETIVDAIRRNSEICLRAIYAPEHGLRGDHAAGTYVPSYTDPETKLPVYSLYGATRRPSAAMLAGVDVLLFDIQDVGDRAYTYISTLAYVMQAAREAQKEVWVLDRPNPIGGDIVEGPVLDPRFSSFIGLYPIAFRHGMTVGELARMYNERFKIGCTLRVIPMEGYHRAMLWPDTGLAWVQTSPNIPDWHTALLYPATGLIDGAGLNNGTNFTKPFAYAGAFGLDAFKLAEFLNARPIPGVHFRAAAWSPLIGLWAGKTLTGVELIVVDRRAFRAVRTAVEILVAVRTLAPSALTFHDVTGLDKDWGTDTLRVGLQNGLDVEAILHQWIARAAEFSAARQPYLLYD